METLKGLPLVENVTSPIPSAVTSFFKSTFATGTGEFGSFKMQDFLGSGVGVSTTNPLENTVAIISSMDVTALTSIYSQMLSTVQGVYNTDPFNPSYVIIPDGPAAGTYISGDLAFTSGLIPAADTIIATLSSTYPAHVTSLNNNFNIICEQYVYEYGNQQRAGLTFADLVENSQQATMSFMSGLANAGTNSMIGGQAPYLTSVADASIQSGQAIIGALREGRNNLLMDKV
jgi:hypothetical protein